MASRVDELFIELQLKHGQFLQEITRAKKELEDLGKKAGATSGNAGALGDSLRRMSTKASNALNVLAGDALGVNNKLGNLAEGLLQTLGVGGPVVAAVSAGILGISLLMKGLRDDLSDTETATRAFIKGLVEESDRATGETLRLQLERAKARKDALEFALGGTLAPAGAGTKDQPGAEIQRATADVTKAALAGVAELAKFSKRELQDQLDLATKGLTEAQRQLDDFKRKHAPKDTTEREQRERDAALQTAQDVLAAASGTFDQTILALGRETQKMIDHLVSGFDKLTVTDREAFSAAIDEKLAELQRLQRAMAAVLDTPATPLNVLRPTAGPRDISIPPLVVKTNKELTDEYEKQRLKLLQQTQLIEDALRGALQMADAFGVVDQNTRRSLDGLLAMATTLPKLVKEVELLGTAGASIGNVVSGALGVLGGITSLVSGLLGGGESPEEKALREALARNVEALDKLRQNIGNIDVNITGTQFGQLQQFAGRVTGGAFPLIDNLPGGLGNRIDRELRDLGLTREELKAAAAELGLEFRNSAEFYRQFAEALKQAEITRFADTFLGAVRAMDAELALFDLDKPIEELQALQKIAAGKVGAPALGGLAGIDLTTAEGRAAAEALIQRLFREAQAGTLDATQLGGLLPREFIELLLELERLIDTVGAEGRQGETVGQAISRSITETSAGTVISVLTTGNVYAQETARNTAMTVEELRTLRQQLTSGGGAPVAEGAALRSMDQIDRELGIRVRRRQRELGVIAA